MGQGKGRGGNDSGADSARVASGVYADVWLFGDALRSFNGLSLQKGDQDALRASVTLPRYFARFANTGSQGLSDKMFKKLGDFKDGSGNTVGVFEFKCYQVRIYGVIRQFRGKRAFVGTACDLKKKQDKADQSMIRRAAEQAGKVE